MKSTRTLKTLATRQAIVTAAILVLAFGLICLAAAYISDNAFWNQTR